MRRLAAIAACAAALAAPASAAAAVGLRTLNSPVQRGSAALLVVQVSGRASRCTVTLTRNARRWHPQGLTPKRPSAGIVSWSWTVAASTPAGNWRLVVSCGAAGRLATVLTVAR
jgi:opacity protein-like surface antigen